MIGPYCQLTAAHGVGLVAGNLGLHPASMTLVPGGTGAQAAQALANCAAVLAGLGFEVRVRLGLRVRVRRRLRLGAVPAGLYPYPYP